jgi:hypothetical protein
MKLSRRKTVATAVSLFLMFAMAFSLVALPTVNAQNFTIYISAPSINVIDGTSMIRLEVRPAGSTSRIRHDWSGVTLGVMYPGRTSWTYEGPYDVDMGGRLDQPFTFNETGAYQFMWIVPPQQELPSNPDDPDGLWYSNVATITIYTTDTLPPGHVPPWEITTYAYISVAPNPVGVGQTAAIYMFLYNTFADEALTNDYRFHNFKLTITKPDGHIETQTWDYISDPTSSQSYFYTPDQPGTYTLKFDFPGQDVNAYSYNPVSDYRDDTYLPSSASTTLTVQEEQIPSAITSYPLPKEYWTRPIYAENTDWWAISSNWLGSGSAQFVIGNFGKRAYVFDAVGPQTSHIMWTKPIQAGGVVGGNTYHSPGVNYFEGSAYINRYSNPIIINGKIYYTEPVSFTSGSGGPTDCVDLRTGELIWSRFDVPSLSFGYIYDLWNPNQHGTYQPILFTSNFGHAYDADTGDHLFDVTSVPSGPLVMGPQGEQLRYVMANTGTRSNPDYYLGQWNSTNLWTGQGFGGGGTSFTPSISGTVDASTSNRYDWQVPIPWLNTMASTPVVLGAYYDDIMLCANGSLSRLPGISAVGIQDSTPITYFAVNLNPSKGTVGTVLWRKTYQPPAGNKTIVPNAVDPVNRVFLEEYRETVEWLGYSLDTGEKLWGPTESLAALSAFDYYGNQFSGHMLAEVAYDNFYSVGFAGILYCYDVKTGELKWTYGNGGPGNSTNSGLAMPYGHYPTMMAAIADGVIYMETTEHTVTNPIYKGALARAVNATDGTEIWTLSAYTGGGRSMSAYGIADGYATWFNGYDNQIYVVGRGPSATTVSASPKVSVHGSSVLVEGTVMDTASGTKQDEQAARFPDGVPVMSDEDMTEWMEYVYQQKPRPTDVTGVEVIVSVLDPNTNFYEVGRATSDENGVFKLMFTPEVPGEYSVYASFEGSEGYWPSQAETTIGVSEAPAASPAPTPTPAPMTDTYVLGIGSAILIAVIVGFVLLLLRKR